MKTFWDSLQAKAGALFGGTDSVDQMQAESDRLDAAIARENKADRERLGDKWYASVEENQNRHAADNESAYGHDVGLEIEQDFESGYRDGLKNISDAVQGPLTVTGDAAGAVTGGIAKGLGDFFLKNWWWILGALAVGGVYFFGLPKFLRKKAA